MILLGMAIDFDLSKKNEVGAFNECADLVANGYAVLHAAHLDSYKRITLRHRRNGHVITIDICRNHYCVKRGGEVKKIVFFKQYKGQDK